MLPLVLGGIALAAVGYGVKEFCESEGCPWDETVSSDARQEENSFKILHENKTKVYGKSVKFLHEHLSKIQNRKEMPLEIWDTKLTEEKLKQNDLTNEIEVYVNLYRVILNDANFILNTYTQKVVDMQHISLDYKEYSKDNKKILKQIRKFLKNLGGILNLQLLDDNKAIDIDSILALREYKKAINKKYEECIVSVDIPNEFSKQNNT